jgi:acyl-CoA synthetase (NDP forming)
MRASRSLRSVLNPERVAVVGASATQGSPGWVLWRNLESFPGERIPVSRSATEIEGVAAYPSLRDVPGAIDLAVIAVPAVAVPDVIDDAVAAGVGACVIVSGGFAESGPQGAALQARIAAAARESGLLIVGPNCLGVQNCDVPLNASLSAGTARGGGGISVITQSGSYAMALHAMSEDEGIGFAVAYSSGNHCDVDDAEVIDHLRVDDCTRVICLFAESVGDGALLLDVARRTTRVKPLVVVAVGRSEAGARAAASHTAALAGDRRAWDNVMASVGISVARSGLEMLDAAKVLSLQPVPQGARAAIITNSGGTGTELSDLLAAEGIDVPGLSPGLRARLDELMPAYASSANPIDVTPAWTRFVQMYPAVIDEVARSGEVDLVIPVLLHRSAENADVARAIVEAVRRLESDGVTVPVYACWVARRDAWPVAGILQEAGIPCLEWPERTARAVGHAVRYSRFLAATRSMPATSARPSHWRAAGAEADARPTGGKALIDLLAAHGIPVVRTRTCTSGREAVAAAGDLGFPVVVKVDHETLSHKTDVGGVRVSLVSPDAVAEAAAALLELAEGARVVVQPQVSGVELVVGGFREPTFGPVVAFGLGGVFVEAIAEVDFAPAPLDVSSARALVESSRAALLLGGYRGLPSVDPAEVARLLCAVGDMMVEHPDLESIDLNPVIAGAHGLAAVDARAAWSA